MHPGKQYIVSTGYISRPHLKVKVSFYFISAVYESMVHYVKTSKEQYNE